MSWFTDLRDGAQSAAAIVGNYYVPGSSVITSNLVSKGSQEQLSSDLGIAAQFASSAVGLGVGSEITGVKASPIGAKIADIAKAAGDSVTAGFKAAGAVTGAALAGNAAAQSSVTKTASAQGGNSPRVTLLPGNSAPQDGGESYVMPGEERKSSITDFIVPAGLLAAAVIFKG